MQDKLSREDFVLERFPDDLLHELEKKEMKEEGIKEGIKEGIQKREREIIQKLLEKKISKEEISSLLDININDIVEIEKKIK